MKIGYVMSRFPKLSETFVLHEMLAMRRAGEEIRIYPLVLERAAGSHPEVSQLEGAVRHARSWSGVALRAFGHFLLRRPWALLTVAVQVTCAHLAPRRAFLASVASLPRAIWMARDMEREGIQHVHAHFATHATTAALVIHRLTGLPFSFTAHAHDIFVSQRMLAEKVREASFVATISEFNKRFIARRVPQAMDGKIHVVHCGADTALFRPGDSPVSPQFHIVCVGRLVEMKGQTFLIDACRLLREREMTFRCSLVGDGPRRPALERQIAAAGLGEWVELLGARPRSVVLDLVRGAGVFVLPSIVTRSGRMEGIPVALMEALACERAVIATRISGIPELITDGENGLLVEPGRADQLADAIARLSADASSRRRLGEAGRRKVLSEFDLETNASRLLSLIAAVHGRRAAAG